jgi:Rod binding domain-containing protein
VQGIGPIRPEARGDTQSLARAPETVAANELKLRQAAEHFEALFVQTLMKSMRSTVPKSDLTESGEIDTYRQMLDEAMSDKLGRSGGLGIAEKVIRQYMPYINGEGPPDTRNAPGMAPLPPERSGGAIAPADLKPVPKATAPRLGPELSRAMTAYAQQAESTKPSLAERAAQLGGAAADTVRQWGTSIENAARENDVAPELLLAVMVQESGGRADAVSSAGAQGLMQLMPATAAELGVDDPLDPEQSIRGGARYLSRMRERFGDDMDLVLAAYNAGPGNVRRAGNTIPAFPETRDYVRKVSALYGDLDGTATLGFSP